MAAQFHSELPVGSDADPYSLVTRDPHRGFFGSLHLGYSYTSAESYAYSISSERGIRLTLGTDLAPPELGSDSTLAALNGRLRGYLPMPWQSHHVLAVALSGGAATGSYPRRGMYYVGGLADTPLLDSFTNGVSQSGFVLRGYRPAQFVGTQYSLLNAEYRAPILYADRGLSTLPVFLRGINGAVFADYGGAFDQLELERPLDSYHLALGAELWFEVALAYSGAVTIRLGHARGMDSEAPKRGQTYLVAVSKF